MTSTFGPAYVEHLDGKRLRTQFKTLLEFMLANDWLTLSEIKLKTGYPESSISADLRHYRKAKFWPVGYKYRTFKERRGGGGTWMYKVVKLPLVEEQKYVQKELFA